MLARGSEPGRGTGGYELSTGKGVSSVDWVALAVAKFLDYFYGYVAVK